MSKENNKNKVATYETKASKKSYIVIILCVVIAIAAIATGLLIWNNNNKKEEANKDEQKSSQTVENKNDKESDVNKEKKDMNNNEEIINPVVTMKIKDYGTVKIELYPNVAPNTVKNFISLINEKYYNGLTFHRIIDGFMIQGGDKAGTGSGETDFTIPGEFAINKFNNNLKHTKGVISMARADYSNVGKPTEGYNSASTQFFIMLEDNRNLDGLYASFGKVTEGMEIIEKIGKVETDANDKPKKAVIIETITVDTFGKDYGEPERLEPFDINAYVNELRRQSLL